MGKLLRYLDNNIVKIGICFLILFVALYPKLPSVHIIRTYVYIRLEDFGIAAVAIIWFIQLLRRKVGLPPKLLAFPIVLYWIIGLASLIASLLYFGPPTLNFFPHIAFLEYLRRIEYMILFFIAFSTIKNKKDVRDYFFILCTTVLFVCLYGIGQKFYGILWLHFPALKSANFCFPSFQTGNEQFAKGYALCLPSDGRMTSTFGGHYDLAAYMVFIIPILITVFLVVKKRRTQILLAILSVLSLTMLIFTSSRVSFIAYLVGVVSALIFFKKKWFILPVCIVSIVLLFVFSSSTIKRFEQTIRFTSVVTDSEGDIVGEVSNVNTNGKKVVKGNIPSQALPEGSVIIGLPTKSISTSSATVQNSLTPEQARLLRLQNGGYQLSSVKGSFLIQKVLTLDISFTTRFQAEWPRAWNSFLTDPPLGTGFSTLTLATDGDYLRMLGESGFLGAISYLFVFLMLGIALASIYKDISSPFNKSFIIGIAGGMIGIFINAIFIDVFEASKVAESMWMILGIGLGTLLLYQKKPIPYALQLKNVLLTKTFYCVYLLAIVAVVFSSYISSFFVADDFTWLHWVATSSSSDILRFFTNSSGFFYRPLDKTIMYFLYTLFSFNPQGYHLFTLISHLIAAIGVFFLARKFLKYTFFSFIAGAIFILLPSQSENIYWISTISTTIATCFIFYGLLAWINYLESEKQKFYILSLFLGICSFFSYEIAITYPFLIILVTLFFKGKSIRKNAYAVFIPFVALIPIYYIIRIVTHAFSGGGDYSYSVIHLLPNIIGNYIGYLGLYIVGERFISLYNPLRLVFKSQMPLVMILIVLFILLIAYVWYFYKKQIQKIVVTQTGKLFIFGMLFIAISLLLYLGLGNISQRYGYLGAFGYSLIIALFLQKISLLLKNPWKIIIMAILLISLFTFYYNEQKSVEAEWLKAASITEDTLAFFRLDYFTLNNSDSVYLVNVPIKYQNAWVFPLGVSDALWFLYKDNEPKLIEVTTIAQAQKDAKNFYNTKLSKAYIFSFGDDGYIYKVK